MVPWLMAQGVLSLVLASLALYYLVLFPERECHNSSDPKNIFNTECHILLWHSVIMIFSLLTLLYYSYVVQEFADQLSHVEKCAKLDPESTASTIVIQDSSKLINSTADSSLHQLSVRTTDDSLRSADRTANEVDLKELHDQHMSHFQQLSVQLLPHEQQRLNKSADVGNGQPLVVVKPKVEKRVRIQAPVPSASEDGCSTGRSNYSSNDQV